MKTFLIVALSFVGLLNTIGILTYLGVFQYILPRSLVRSVGGGGDGLGLLAWLYFLAIAAALAWFVVVPMTGIALYHKSVPQWFLYPLIAVVISGLPIIYAAYVWHSQSREYAEESAVTQLANNKDIEVVAAHSDVREEIDSLIARGIPTTAIDVGDNRTITVPTYIDRYDIANSMLHSSGGTVRLVTVHHVNADNRSTYYSVYEVRGGVATKVFDHIEDTSSDDETYFNQHMAAVRLMLEWKDAHTPSAEQIDIVRTTLEAPHFVAALHDTGGYFWLHINLENNTVTRSDSPRFGE